MYKKIVYRNISKQQRELYKSYYLLLFASNPNEFQYAKRRSIWFESKVKSETRKFQIYRLARQDYLNGILRFDVSFYVNL